MNQTTQDQPIGAVAHQHNLDDLRRLRDEAMAAGPGSGRWIKAANRLMDAFPDYYATAKAMNERQVRTADAARGVIAAFENLGKTTDVPGVLVSRSMCENALIRLKEAVNHE
jgi:hypothetical protein